MENYLILISRQNIIVNCITSCRSLSHGDRLESGINPLGYSCHNLIGGCTLNSCSGSPEIYRDIPAKTISINVNGISGTSSSRDYISNLGRGRHFGCLVLPYANAAARNSKRRYEIVLHSRGSTKQGSVQIIRILSGGEICLNCRNNACTIGLSVDCNDNYVIVELSFKNHHIIITIANGCSAVCNCIV